MLLTIRISSWEEARRLVSYFSGEIFRGQERSDWGLSPSLERVANQFSHPKNTIPFSELKVVDEFRRRAHFYLDYTPPEHSLIDWLSLIQHHGGPTRLLDFSYSFFVASFFAVSQAVSDAAVWVIDKHALALNAHQIAYPEKYRGIESLDKFIDTVQYDNATMKKIFEESFLSDKPPQAVIPLDPLFLTPRLSIQQGVFLVPCAVTCDFQECLSSTLGSNANDFFKQDTIVLDSKGNSTDKILDLYANSKIMKIIIPKECHKAAIEDLWSMNINAATLFPGLDGFAKSLVYHFRGYEIDEEYSKRIFKRLAAILQAGKKLDLYTELEQQ